MKDIIGWMGLNGTSSVENCRVQSLKEGFLIESDVTGVEEDVYFHCSYSTLTDTSWHTKEFKTDTILDWDKYTLEIKKNSLGQWEREDVIMNEFVTCIDIDLTVSPVTNTLPVIRLALKIGESKTIAVLYIDICGKSIQRGGQVYTRLQNNKYHFKNASGILPRRSL